ncbi:alpha/beta hydrolase [Glutamicibacter sp. JC586]|uniref:alpha/beta hydrolase n=1 Tax=Glutamicibacter sp. JC586 TaxID=2590552 RepID=UPI001356DF62|nr:phospholipase [Glutamicibacter sp. JC586]
MTSYETAPVAIISRNDDSRLGTPLLVFLHGYGSNEQDLMGLSRYLPEEFTYLSVRAPLKAGPGYSWFPLTQDIDYSTEAVGQSVQALWSLLQPLSEQHSSITLLGFSQGMAMATSLARYQRDSIKAVVGLSGFAVEPRDLQMFDDRKLVGSPLPMFWGRDLADPVITRDKIAYTLEWISKHVELTSETYPQIGHSVSMEELGDVNAFLKKTVLEQY